MENEEKQTEEKQVEVAEAPLAFVKPLESYKERIQKMSDKQLRAEVRREANKPRGSKKEITALAVVLGVMLDSHVEGRRAFV